MNKITSGLGATSPSADDEAIRADKLRDAYQKIRKHMSRVIVGQDDVIEQLAISLFAGGHCILEGVPGLAKTLMISTLARSVSLSFNRIQFTPDLMPSDITGTEVIQEDRSTGTREFKFLPGPIFANVILADEINRTPPKTQAALLEAMQERQVTIGGRRHELAPPFFVLATQNPIEQEGTYPLPEAQQDRFLFKILIDYPTRHEEYAIAEMLPSDSAQEDNAILHGEDIIALQRLVRRVPTARHVIDFALDVVRNSRPGEEGAPDFIRNMVRWGAGPRAVQFLLLAAKARAVLHGSDHVATDDVRHVARPVLRHRLVCTFGAEAEGYTTDRIIDDLLAAADKA